MKLKKVLGNILTGLGCVILLIGLAAFLLPRIDNRQLKLVLSTFQTPSDNWLIQLMNNGMNFAMEHCFLMLLIGSAVMLIGILLNISARTNEETHAQRNARKTKTAAGPVYAAYQRSAAPQFPAEPLPNTPVRPAEDNPFARYMTDGSLPKSTAARAGVQAAVPKATQPQQQTIEQQAQEDVLKLWKQIQQQPEASDDLHIQPVYVADDQAYRRPAEAPEAPQSTPVMPEPEKVLEEPAFYAFEEDPAESDAAIPEPDINENPAIDMIPEPMPSPEPIPSPEPVTPPAPVSIPIPETKPAQPASDGPRPIIRSTFRKSTPAQPADPPVADVESEPAAQPLQPASRIKSTMGRKR